MGSMTAVYERAASRIEEINVSRKATGAKAYLNNDHWLKGISALEIKNCYRL